MAAFEPALTLVLKHEGGFSDHPADVPTNYGISQPVLSDYLGKQASKEDMRNLSLSTARDIYLSRYWRRIGGDAIENQAVAERVMDMAVLRGVTAASKAVQTALQVKADGIIGPVTVAALNKTGASGFLLTFMKLCVAAFASIVTSNPSKLDFLRNWCGMALEMSGVISALSDKSDGSSLPEALPPAGG